MASALDWPWFCLLGCKHPIIFYVTYCFHRTTFRGQVDEGIEICGMWGSSGNRLWVQNSENRRVGREGTDRDFCSNSLILHSLCVIFRNHFTVFVPDNTPGFFAYECFQVRQVSTVLWLLVFGKLNFWNWMQELIIPPLPVKCCWGSITVGHCGQFVTGFCYPYIGGIQMENWIN